MLTLPRTDHRLIVEQLTFLDGVKHLKEILAQLTREIGEDATIISSASSAAGAFPFGGNSRDSAMIVMLPPGAYTVQLSGVNNATGVGIVEVYDVDP